MSREGGACLATRVGGSGQTQSLSSAGAGFKPALAQQTVHVVFDQIVSAAASFVGRPYKPREASIQRMRRAALCLHRVARVGAADRLLAGVLVPRGLDVASGEHWSVGAVVDMCRNVPLRTTPAAVPSMTERWTLPRALEYRWRSARG